MSHVERRGPKRWMAVYRDPDTGKPRARSFPTKRDADSFLSVTVADQLRGLWVDPRAGKITVREYGETWLAERDIRATTRERYEGYFQQINLLGDKPIGDLLPSHLRTWQAGVRRSYAVSTTNTIRGVFAAMLKTAVFDRVITSSPFVGVPALKADEGEPVVPMPLEIVQSIAAEICDRYHAAVLIGAGCGLRRGETFALRAETVNMLGRKLTVNRGVIQLGGQHPTLGPPKTKASNRVVPMPRFVVEALAAHMAKYPPGDGGLIFTTSRGNMVGRSTFGPAWVRAGAPAGSRFHDLRHFYASTLIHAGESVKVIQARLGHASAQETLDTYGHLFPDSEDSTRAAMDAAFAPRTIEQEEAQ